MRSRGQVQIKGIVQGVGFRPFIYNLARKYQLSGSVLNDSLGVSVDVEGEEQAISDFLAALQANPPPLAQIESLEFRKDVFPLGYTNFSIKPSVLFDEESVLLSPDIATCEQCVRELFDPTDRRYRYPFINCTDCGPRFTIIEGIPYDRERTTMSVFRMCARCHIEYEDPTNRRFHAQPNACPACGPHAYLIAPSGERLDWPELDAVSAALRRIKQGEIVAIKGIGGFHFACDALNVEAIDKLRRRKYREDKPFALMARDVAMIREFCNVSEQEERLLLSERRPIVLLRKKPCCSVPDVAAPRQKGLGFMLPYTPLHYLLLAESGRPLVMTSGNISDEPISYKNQDAIQRLSAIADSFVMHGRDIHTRLDDSVIRFVFEKEYPLRRSRGYVPLPIKVPFHFDRDILACGGELKNTFCIAHRNYAFVSHHIGDLENLETLRSFEEGISHFKKLFHVEPDVVAYDLHPEYLPTKYALALENIPLKVAVQHHHAHVASCMADNNLDGEVIGVVMDGLGYGTDGHFWGSEFFIASFHDYQRMAHLQYVPMPGGMKAIKEPWRMAAVYLDQALGESFLDLSLPFVKRLNRDTWKVLKQMIHRRINSPLTSGMGRLFDAVSSLLGLRDTVHYEGQAAIELEMIACESCPESYEFELDRNGGLIHTEPVIKAIVQDLKAELAASVVAARFHNAVAGVIVRVAARIRQEQGLKRVLLTGGAFQNMLLLSRTCERLEERGFQVYMHHRVPPNDGGLSLGQAVVAHARIKAGRI